MRKQLFIPMVAAIVAFSAVQAFAESATFVMRNGDRVRADLIDMGRNFTISVNGQTREVPLGDVVLIDFGGDGQNLWDMEVSKANAANGGYVVMRNGENFNASLQDFTGKPLIAVFSNGRKVNVGEVARIYLGSVNNVPGFPNQSVNNPSAGPNDTRSTAPGHARSVVVPGNVQWTNTGFNVRRGQMLRFEASGEIRLSTNGDDVSRAAGSPTGRKADKATIPTIPVGALIGRVGNGQPFSIGDGTQAFDMPDNGRLFLGVNDDHVNDNSGNYVVRVWEQ